MYARTGQKVSRQVARLLPIILCFVSAPKIDVSVVAQAVGEGTARVTVQQQISLSKIQDLNFGNMIAGSTLSTMTMSVSESGMTTGDAKYFGGGQIAQFLVGGEIGRTFTVTVGPDPLVLTSVIGDTMVVHDFVTTGPMEVVKDGSILYVSASVDINPGQNPAAYRGSFSVTAHYN